MIIWTFTFYWCEGSSPLLFVAPRRKPHKRGVAGPLSDFASAK